ncbi:alginate export family protein [Glaciecola sp. XM2]|uniref:alginate export family protein n=1 Tax=Glaciecola sp. XM2 TaxID=1914931 RepID=UPI001BDF3812|nr:alginate export family protein [Glaciecola sp. XM2]MBT1451806.1 alginate export family protein [Glaciecola sp. XM2]
MNHSTQHNYAGKTSKLASLTVAVALAFTVTPFANAKSDTVYEAISSGKAFADLRLRYEGVSQDNPLQDADALTFRTRLGYTSGSLDGFSFTVELEDNRIALGQGDYTVGPTGYNLGIYSVVADPEFTELDQGFIQYKKDGFTAKVGRQVIALDNHRFIGHVGWRQDRQTFDAATIMYAPSEDWKVHYSYINQRNRIFGEAADLDSKDHLLNASLNTEYGTLVAYSYLLEVDNESNNALDTYGFSFKGKKSVSGTPLIYAFEYATQSAQAGSADFDADYLFAQIGTTVSGVTAQIGYEVLGSDEGNYGFATPLSTLHAFNGWSDQFLGTPAQGLVDTTFRLSGSVGKAKWLVVYHNFEADESSATVDDLGNEINLQYVRPIAEKYTLGVKYADYSGEDARVDADKLWIWLSTKF